MKEQEQYFYEKEIGVQQRPEVPYHKVWVPPFISSFLYIIDCFRIVEMRPLLFISLVYIGVAMLVPKSFLPNNMGMVDKYWWDFKIIIYMRLIFYGTIFEQNLTNIFCTNLCKCEIEHRRRIKHSLFLHLF